MARIGRLRTFVVAATATLGALGLAGCSGITPYAVADHDAKMEYHAGMVEGLLTDEVFATLSQTENFSSVGYSHAVASSGESLHVQHETSVMGGTWWSRESSDAEGSTIDRVHMAGESMTYYLFGDLYLPVSGTPWVSFPEGDILQGDPASTCLYPSVWYLCGIALAWSTTSASHESDMPVLVERSADGSMHLQSAVTLRAIVDAGIFSISESLSTNISDETFDAFLPLHVWFDESGLVTKAEINGSFGSDPTLEVQLGFEMKGEPLPDDQPTDPGTLDPKYITAITDESQINTFWADISAIRVGS